MLVAVSCLLSSNHMTLSVSSNIPVSWLWAFASAVPAVWKIPPLDLCLTSSFLVFWQQFRCQLQQEDFLGLSSLAHICPLLRLVTTFQISRSLLHHKKFLLYLMTCVLTLSLTESNTCGSGRPACLFHQLIRSPRNGAWHRRHAINSSEWWINRWWLWSHKS